MTREEAIEYGLRWKNAIIDRGDTEWSDAIQFLNMAIEALDQEPSCRNTRQVDLISRQDAIDALYDKGLSMTEWGELLTMKWSDIQKCIEQLPSAEPKWIPISERLPEVGQYVLASVHTDYAEHNIILTRYEGRQPFWSNGIITAWMPLPGPYKESDEE